MRGRARLRVITEGWQTPATSAEARILARACLFAGLMAFVTAAVPFSPTAPTLLTAVLGVVGLLLSAGLWWASERVPRVALHVVVATATALVSLCIAASTTPAGTVVTSFSYLWIAMYTAWFHTDRATAVHLGVIGVGFAVGLAVCDAPSPVQTWMFVMVCVGGVAWTLHTLVVRLRHLADRDQLTGLLTRGAFATVAERSMALARRHGRALTVALLDLDDFKLVNDRDGHAVGDRVLVDLATAWTAVLRRSDVLGRHGGDEFILLMPDTTASGARAVLGRLQAVSTAGRWTAGVAQWDGEDLARWVSRADEDLYTNKGLPPSARPLRVR